VVFVDVDLPVLGEPRGSKVTLPHPMVAAAPSLSGAAVCAHRLRAPGGPPYGVALVAGAARLWVPREQHSGYAATS
jgi:hypothetical protein